jgi:hypothetical protein
MAGHVDDLVQRKHHFAIVDEVDSVLIDDARTPLIISGPTPKGDEHEFHELKPRNEKVVNAQKQYVQQCLNDAKKMLNAAINNPPEDKNESKRLLEEGGIALLRAHRGLPKNRALIKFLSEPGIKVHLQKTENFYMQEQGKHMKKIDVELFFVIDEKNNTIELTEKGINLMNKTSIDETWHLINYSSCFVTMDSGLLHLAGTTDVEIIQLGSSIKPEFRIPYRQGSQQYKYNYITGGCNLACASDMKHGVREWGTVQGIAPLIGCLENKSSFECQPTVIQIYNRILELYG